MRNARTAVACLTLLAGLTISMPLVGQLTLHISDEVVFAGDPVQTQITVDLDQEILGFSFGVRHDATVLTPTVIDQGPALSVLNGGTGAEYFITELAPANGPGVYVASAFTLGFPFAVLPIGSGQQVVTIGYSSSPSAAAGSTSVLTGASDLGSPTVNIVFTSPTAQTLSPTVDNGGVTFDVPAPTATTCTLTDPCACDFTISWTNGAAYTGVEVRLDGVLIQTLPGSATSTSLSLAAPGTSGTVAVRGVIGALDSVDDTCVADCPAIVSAPIPSGFTCQVTTADPVFGCVVDVSWTLQGTYSSLQVLVDGVQIASLPGTATTTTINLTVSPAPQQICLQGTDECGDPLATNVCCDVTCFPGVQFIRGECNGDGSIDISDTVFLLAALFAGGAAPPCDDACDNNDDGALDISDGIYLLLSLFGGGAPPVAPNPACGVDPTDNDPLGCQSFPGC